MWGHNNGATTVKEPISTKDFGAGTGVSGANLSSFTPINRAWKMVVTDSIPTVKLSIPESMVSAARNPGGEDYVMIIADDDTVLPQM